MLDRFAEEQAWPEEELRTWQNHCVLTDEAFETMLVNQWPDQQFTLPKFWNDPAFNAPSQPVVGVCWFEARAYCLWLSAQSGKSFRLPMEAQGEAAARGLEGRRYAWGNDYDETHCNVLDTKLRRTTPVGVFPQGDTPVLFQGERAEDVALSDMIGNAWEWTSSCYTPYPYQSDDGREDMEAEVARVLRGGSWYDNPGYVRASVRYDLHPVARFSSIGFRVLCSSPI